MRNALSLTLLAALAAASHASLTLTLDNPVLTVARPMSGTIEAVLTGTITSSNPDDEMIDFGVSNPRMWTDDYHVLSSEHFADVTLVNGTYSGAFAYFDIHSDTEVGTYERTYDLNEYSKVEFFVGQFGDGVPMSAGYKVVVADAVPEPASMAALGLGAVGLLRRRKRA